MGHIIFMGFLCLSLFLSFTAHGSDGPSERSPSSANPIILSQKNNTYFGKISHISSLVEHVDSFIIPPKMDEGIAGRLLGDLVDIDKVKAFMETPIYDAKDVLIVVDWDNTMSQTNGSSLPLREGTITHQTIKKLVDRGIPLIILTSRLSGSSAFIHVDDQFKINPTIFSPMMSSAANIMIALNISLPPVFVESTYNFLYPVNDLKLGQYPSPNGSLYTTLIYGNIVFAGAPDQSIKGPGLTDLIDRKLFIHPPKLIFFVDNDLAHVESILDAFKSREETVVGLFYPQAEEETKNPINLLIP